MIHRPPVEDFQQFRGNYRKPWTVGEWFAVLACCLALGAAISGIVSAFRGWSPTNPD